MKKEEIFKLPPEMKGKSLQEIADYLEGREVFPEANKRVREIVAKVKWPKELLVEKK